MINRICISLNDKCNLKCKYCHFYNKQDEMNSIETLNFSQIKEILNNVYSYIKKNKITNFKIGLVGSGEPLLSLDLIKNILTYTKENKMQEYISFYTITNGTVNLNENTLLYFFENKDLISLNFSLDGYKELHDLCRINSSYQGTYNIVIKNINLYKKIFNKSPIINLTVHKQTILNKEKLLNFLKNNFEKVVFSRLIDVCPENNLLYINRNEFDCFLKYSELFYPNSRQKETAINKKYDCTMFGSLCGVGKNNIYYSGKKVYPCGRFIGKDKYLIGSYNDKLQIIEENMKVLDICKDNQCFYDTYVKGDIL